MEDTAERQKVPAEHSQQLLADSELARDVALQRLAEIKVQLKSLQEQQQRQQREQLQQQQVQQQLQEQLQQQVDKLSELLKEQQSVNAQLMESSNAREDESLPMEKLLPLAWDVGLVATPLHEHAVELERALCGALSLVLDNGVEVFNKGHPVSLEALTMMLEENADWVWHTYYTQSVKLHGTPRRSSRPYAMELLGVSRSSRMAFDECDRRWKLEDASWRQQRDSWQLQKNLQKQATAQRGAVYLKKEKQERQQLQQQDRLAQHQLQQQPQAQHELQRGHKPGQQHHHHHHHHHHHQQEQQQNFPSQAHTPLHQQMHRLEEVETQYYHRYRDTGEKRPRR